MTAAIKAPNAVCGLDTRQLVKNDAENELTAKMSEIGTKTEREKNMKYKGRKSKKVN